MAKEMLINVSEGEECRIALVEDGVLEELYMERQSSTSHVNNIYKGRVMNVEASIQAAFIDFGLGRNGFLHISDLLPTYFGHKGEDIQEAVGRKMARRDRPPIQRCLRRGDELLVQVIKEGIGTKGPTLSTYLSIPGKILVMMPGMVSKGVSRKIEDEDERRRLRQILDQLDPPDDCGFIIRTAGVGKSKAEIERDLKYLARLWETIKKKRDNEPAPVELYIEGDLVTRTVRDLFAPDVDHLVIDNRQVAERVQEVIKLSNPRAKNRVDLYEEPIPLFHKYGIEAEIEQMYSRHVPLRSGGSLVIDSTEAIVAIDVNSGKFRDHSDAETTAFKIDMEAADEICRQLKLRDLGGVIICDFIDLRYERHRRELEQRLHDNLKNDRAKTKVLRMSQFGIIEMTRQRMRPSLKRSVYFDCPHCKGAGLVKTPESMGLDVMRRLAIAINDSRVVRVELSVNSDVSFYLQNKKRIGLARLEYDTGKQIVVHGDPKLGLDEMRLNLFDNRDGVVVIDELAAVSKSIPHTTQLNTRQQQSGQQRGRGKRDDGRGHGQRQQQQHKPRHAHHEEEESREDFDREVAAIEDRTDDYESQSEDTNGAAREPYQETGERRDEREEVGAGEVRDDRNRGPRRHRDDGGPAPRGYRNDRPEGRDDRDNREQRDTHAGSDNRGGRDMEPAQQGGVPRDDRDAGEFQEGEGGGRRRRRRRRRRGRGRGRREGVENGQPAPQGQSDQDRPPYDTNEDFRGEPLGEIRDDDGDVDTDEIGAPGEPFEEDESHDSVAASAREAREHREDEEFDRELRDIESDAAEQADARVQELTGESDDRVERVALLNEAPQVPIPPGTPEAATAAEKPDEAETTPKRGRGRGGRGRGKKPTAEKPAPKSKIAKEPAGTEEQPKKRRSSTRGGKGRGKRGAAAEPERQSSANPQAEKSASAPAIAEAPIVRTGSTDKHLHDEEPVLHEPVRRPRSYRDLDHIPDDYD